MLRDDVSNFDRADRHWAGRGESSMLMIEHRSFLTLSELVFDSQKETSAGLQRRWRWGGSACLQRRWTDHVSRTLKIMCLQIEMAGVSDLSLIPKSSEYPSFSEARFFGCRSDWNLGQLGLLGR
jgi:hypothetical protein